MTSFWENFKVDGQDMRMYASVPSGSGPFPAIVVAQHGGGVDQFIQSILRIHQMIIFADNFNFFLPPGKTALGLGR